MISNSKPHALDMDVNRIRLDKIVKGVNLWSPWPDSSRHNLRVVLPPEPRYSAIYCLENICRSWCLLLTSVRSIRCLKQKKDGVIKRWWWLHHQLVKSKRRVSSSVCCDDKSQPQNLVSNWLRSSTRFRQEPPSACSSNSSQT